MPSPRPRRAILAALAACAGAAHAQDQAEFIIISNAFLHGVAPDGLAVAGDIDDAAVAGVPGLPLTQLGDFGYPVADRATAIGGGGGSDRYTVVGYARHTSRDCEAFRWTASGRFRGLGDLPGGPFHSQAHAISDDGRIIAGLGTTATGVEAALWVDGAGAIGLGALAGATESSAFGVSNDGSVVVGESDRVAFRWDAAGGMVALTDPAGAPLRGAARDASAGGAVIVGDAYDSVRGANMAFRWTEAGGAEPLGLLGFATQSYARAVSADGKVVVGRSGFEIDVRAFIWTQFGGMGDLKSFLLDEYGLDIGRAELRDVTDISPDGRTLVGYGWVVRLPYSPGCRADVNADGALDVFDFLAFQLLFAQGCTQRSAQFNATGEISEIEAVSHDGVLVAGHTGIPDYMPRVGRIGLPLTHFEQLAPETIRVRAIEHVAAPELAVIAGWAQVSAEESEAFRWTSSSGFRGLGALPAGDPWAIATDMSADGATVVGYSATDGGLRSFRWTAGDGLIDLGLAHGAFSSRADAVSSDGSVIVGGNSLTDPFSTIASRWSATGGMELLDPGRTIRYSTAHGVSDNGVVVGYAADQPPGSAFRWTEGAGLELLGTIPGGGPGSNARAISADGAVIVGTADTDAVRRAFIWTRATGMRDFKQVLETEHGLDLSNWLLYDATAISADGRTIVGRGKNGGRLEGWSVTFPEPDCPPDFDDDGQLTLFDFLAFANLFAAGCD